MLASWLHFIHVVAAVIWLGGGVMLLLIAARARSSGDAKAAAEFARMLPYVGLRALTPAMVALLGTGLWMIFAGSGWTFSQFWVRLALVLFALVFLVGVLYMSRIGARLTRLAADGGSVEQGIALLSRWMGGYGLVIGLLLIAVWDMVFKPVL
jgi:uncharacterized membrane protein